MSESIMTNITKKNRINLDECLDKTEPTPLLEEINVRIGEINTPPLQRDIEYPEGMVWGRYSEQGYRCVRDYRRAYFARTGNISEQLQLAAEENFLSVKKFGNNDIVMRFKGENHRRDFIDSIAQLCQLRLGQSIVRLNERLDIEGFISFSYNAKTPDQIDSIEVRTTSQDFYDQIKVIIKENLVGVYGQSKVIRIDAVNQGGLVTSEVDMDKETKLATPDFYPWMLGMSVEEYFTEYMESSSPLLILYGIPGTAKTTMMRTAIKRLGLNAMMSANAQVTSDGAFVAQLIAHLEKKGSETEIIFLEDADAMLRSRKDNNLALNALLSMMDGIGATGVKLVVLSNCENLEDIDPALLRHGRTYDTMKFDKLTIAQADKARCSIGMPPMLDAKGSLITIAQALTPDGRRATTTEANDHLAIVAPRFPLKAKRDYA